MSNDSIFDWGNLPDGVKPVSLYNFMHDGEILEITSDALVRSASLKFTTYYEISEMHFYLDFTGVKSLRATLWHNWPGEFSAAANLTRDEHSKLVDEYRSKGHTESSNWSDFQESASRDRFEIFDADLASNDEAVAFSLSGRHDDENYYDIVITAEVAKFRRQDGLDWDLAKMIELSKSFYSKQNQNRK